MPFATPRGGDLRIEGVEVPAHAAPGETVEVALVVLNGGDEPAVVHLAADGPAPDEAVRRAVPPCSLARVVMPLAIPVDVLDGAGVERAIVAWDDLGRRARAPVALRVRRPIVASDAPPDEDEPRARAGATLRAPERVASGAAFDVRLEIAATGPLERLLVRASLPAGTRYVRGSARIDGCAVIDCPPSCGEDAFPLDGAGVALGDVPAGTTIAIAWQVLAPDAARDGTELELTAALDVDGTPVAVEPRRVAVEPRVMFASVPAGVPFRLAGCVLAPPADLSQPPHDVDAAGSVPFAEAETHVEAAADDAAVASAPAAARVLRIDDERVDAVRRLQRALRSDGLVAHCFALRLFFPEASGGDASLDAVRAALDDVYDRVYVKLRIPAFAVTADDLDDARLRDALATSAEPVVVTSCGAPAGLRAMLRLLDAPCPGDPHLGAAVATHARALDAVLERYDGLPLELFDDALARRSDGALDAARTALLDALAPYLAEEHVAC